MNRVYLSDAEKLKYMSGGIVSKGAYLQKDLKGSISPRNHLIEIPDDVQFYLPSMPETAETFEMFNKEISEQVGSVLNNGNTSLAIKFFGLIFNFFSRKKQDVKKLNGSKDPYFKKWLCKEILTTIFVPTASVRMENTTRCKLSTQALKKLQMLDRSFKNVGLSDDFVNQCNNFFMEFGSHYFIGTYHLGGLRKDTLTEKHKETEKGKGKDKTKHPNFSTVDNKYEKFGGFSSNDEICNWKRSLVGNPINWCVIDKEESSAMNYCAVWNLIDADYFKKSSEFRDALHEAWKKNTGISINPEIDGTYFILENQIKAIEKNTEKDIFLLKLTEILSILKERKTTVLDIIRHMKNKQLNTITSGREEMENEITNEDSEMITSQLFEEYSLELNTTCDVEESIGKLVDRKKMTTMNLANRQEDSGQSDDSQTDLSSSNSSSDYVNDSFEDMETEHLDLGLHHCGNLNCPICRRHAREARLDQKKMTTMNLANRQEDSGQSDDSQTDLSSSNSSSDDNVSDSSEDMENEDLDLGLFHCGNLNCPICRRHAREARLDQGESNPDIPFAYWH